MITPIPKYKIGDKFTFEDKTFGCTTCTITTITMRIDEDEETSITYQYITVDKHGNYSSHNDISEGRLNINLKQGIWKPYNPPLINWWRYAKSFDRIIIYSKNYINGASLHNRYTVVEIDGSIIYMLDGIGKIHEWSEERFHEMISNKQCITTVKVPNE